MSENERDELAVALESLKVPGGKSPISGRNWSAIFDNEGAAILAHIAAQDKEIERWKHQAIEYAEKGEKYLERIAELEYFYEIATNADPNLEDIMDRIRQEKHTSTNAN